MKFYFCLVFFLSSVVFADSIELSNPSQNLTKNPAEEAKVSTKLIPLPIYATLPSEGSTFGFMPVFLKVQKETQHTDAIYAPSVSWNRVIGTTGTWRLFDYPTSDKTFTFTASASTHVNYGTLLIWENHPTAQGEFTDDASFRGQRSIFFRFFGFGPDTPAGNESSNTRLRTELFYRKGYNIGRYFNVGAKVDLQRDILQNYTAPDLPQTMDSFPGTPGLGGATILTETADVRYDTRVNGDYSERGWYAALRYGTAQGISNSPTFTRAEAEMKALIPETDFMQSGARAYYSYVSSPGVPFYYQSTLGGSYLLRGFTEDRFIDQGAWELEAEQRITMFQTHIYGVTTSWRADPFVTIGQVYRDGSQFFTHVRVAEGIGFRAWVQPNVLGRVDFAYAGEGPKFYVELGYPF